MTADADEFASGAYGCIAYLVGIVTFLAGWAYAISQYGWFLGGGLGWLPAFFIAVIVGFLWPLLVLGIGALYLYSRGL